MDKTEIETTDWTKYYQRRKSIWSTFSQRHTRNVLYKAIQKYLHTQKIDILELGGGNSCFADAICSKIDVNSYDIIDNNLFANTLFEQKKSK